ncbi:MAG: ATP-binding protein, partial [Pygmaiobacter sp.]
DEGAGIPPEDLASVKLKFFKGRGAARGSGIGLAVVDELVTLHGGAFDITSSYGKGTTAIVRLPMKISAATLPAQSEAEQSSLQDAPQQYGERITQKGTIEQ